jgi:hypothetical protein
MNLKPAVDVDDAILRSQTIHIPVAGISDFSGSWQRHIFVKAARRKTKHASSPSNVKVSIKQNCAIAFQVSASGAKHKEGICSKWFHVCSRRGCLSKSCKALRIRATPG